MLRFQVSEAGHGALPAVDIADDRVVLGSGPDARLRLPARVARDAHVRFEGGRWHALADVVVDEIPRKAGDSGALGPTTVFAIGTYEVVVSASPADAPASTPQRTESIARELVRAMLGAGAAPSFEIERGPDAGSTRALPPPEATIVIGRGDDADWVILDEDLSRMHAEVRRGWDGVTIRDRGSKNGTLVDGIKCSAEGTELHDGASIAMGNVTLRFRDPAERHLVGAPLPPPELAPKPPGVTTRSRASVVKPAVTPVSGDPAASSGVSDDIGPPPARWPFAVAVTIAALSAVALVYVLAS